ncbi:MAG: flippase-like domain-containing protein [Chloroflexi bacterium]|nr:flippase-like domain-containing protein [Chloroflexota bacterium]
MLTDKRVWVGVAISLVFLALFLGETDLGRLGAALSGAQYGYVLVAALLYFPGVWCRAARWRVLLAPLRELSVARLYPVVVIGYMVNDVLPLRAGEVARAYLLRRREGISPAATLATIGVERVSDGLTLLALAAAVALGLPLADWLRDLLRAMAVLFLVGFAVVLAVAVRETWSRWLLYQVVRRLPEALASPLGSLAGRFLEGLRALQRPERVAALFGWALLAWLGELLVFYVVALAFDLGQPLTVLALAMAASNLATSLPSSQGGIGPFEFFCAQTLLAFGTEPGLATAYTIVLHAVLILPVVLAGCFHLWQEQVGLRAVLGRGAGPSPQRP